MRSGAGGRNTDQRKRGIRFRPRARLRRRLKGRLTYQLASSPPLSVEKEEAGSDVTDNHAVYYCTACRAYSIHSHLCAPVRPISTGQRTRLFPVVSAKDASGKFKRVDHSRTFSLLIPKETTSYRKKMVNKYAAIVYIRLRLNPNRPKPTEKLCELQTPLSPSNPSFPGQFACVS